MLFNKPLRLSTAIFVVLQAFTNEQKKKLLSWRQQTQKLLHAVPQRCVMDRQRVSYVALSKNTSLIGVISRVGKPKNIS